MPDRPLPPRDTLEVPPASAREAMQGRDVLAPAIHNLRGPMGLRERVNEKSRELVQRKTITLPRSGESVVCRSLMAGHVMRVGDQKDQASQAFLLVALGTEDAETNRPIWMAHSQEHRDEIDALHLDDVTAIVDTVRELSGIDGSGAAAGN